MPPLTGNPSGRATVTAARGLWRALVLAALVASLRPAQAAEVDSRWQINVWKTSEGLAGNNVASVVETADGFLWVVAGGELVRFDGARFAHHPTTQILGPPARRIRELVPLKHGGAALALTDGAIYRLTAAGAEPFAVELPDTRARMEAMADDGEGGLLVTYNDESVWHLQGGRARRLGEADGAPPGAHTRFVPDHRGRLWFAKGGHVGLFRAGRFEPLQRFNAATRVAAARRGGVWIGASARLFHFDVDGPLVEVAEIGIRNIPVRPTMLWEDREGAVWFGTYASGLFRFDGDEFTSVPISHGQVVSLTEDREGSLWVGTSGGGLNQIQPRALSIEGSETGTPSETPQALAEDSASHLWAVTQNGLLVERADGAWRTPPQLDFGDVNCVAADPVAGVWIGTNTQLHLWRDGRLTTWGRADGLETAPVRSVIPTPHGLWIGGGRPGALQRWRAGKFESFALPQRTDSIRALALDAAGQLWVAGGGSFLARVTRDDRVIDETARVAAVGRQVRTMHATPDGSVWIGYDQGGLGRIHGNGFGRITKRQGLLDDNLELVVSDGHGWLWLAGNQVIFKVRLEELAAAASGRADHVRPVRHGHELRAVFGATVGALRRRDGRLWIPMATSLAIIDPALQRADSPPPPVLITGITVDEQRLAAYRGLVPLRDTADLRQAALQLPPGHRRITVDFTALSFRTPANVHFRYRLEDFDDRWIEAGTQRSVAYSRLPAGDYRFRVKASNSDGVWNESGATLAFTVQPFFWETWWFRAVALVIFTTGIFALARVVANRRLRRRLRAAEQEMAVERERTRIARDIHDDLGSRLTKIVLLSGLVERERAAPDGSPAASGRVREISETARQVLKSLDETVWAVNPRNDNLPHLVSYLGQFAVNFLRAAEIGCELDLPDDPPALPVAADVRHHLFLAVKEALTNVVRHAQAPQVTLRIALSRTHLEIHLADNGRGFTPAPPGTAADEADGLPNMAQRLAQIGGEMHLESSPGAGTRVRFTLPLPQSQG